ncbi:MAG: alpha/beta hydrolase [Candidatus Omnitrophica bacterium]|nr:alpha/beta hydrolase [Candidatus Omnitrophota bacterium]
MRKISRVVTTARLVFFVLMSVGVIFSGEACWAGEAGSRNFDRLAQQSSFTRTPITTNLFSLLSYVRITSPGEPLRIYIEGDGLAWKGKRTLSDDPTPRDTLVLRLAALDPSANVAYLARPCQFMPRQPACGDQGYWSDKRFSPEVVQSLNEAVNRLEKLAVSSQVELVGFSGGGALALLLAKDRQDVVGVRTIAGNLDHRAFNEYHHTTPMDRSLNPADFLPELKGILQRHYSCREDRIVPTKMTEDFLEALGPEGLSSLTVIDHCAHNKGWDKQWLRLLSLPLVDVNEPTR